MQELTNAGKPALITTLACYTTDYVSPVTDALGHELLLGADRGAVAINSSSVLNDFGENGSMAMNTIRFQPGLSIFDFLQQFGNEEQCEKALEKAR